MSFDLSTIMELWDDNKDWLLRPLILCSVILVLGLVLMILTSGDLGFFVKFTFILLLFLSPVGGYYIAEYFGDQLGVYVDPVFAEVDALFDKVLKR